MDLSFKPTLLGERTVLRPFAEQDADIMWDIFTDPEVIKFTFEPSRAMTPDRLRGWYGTRSDQIDRLDLAVCDLTSGEVVGEVVFYSCDWAARKCMFRMLIGPRGRLRGIGTEAALLVINSGFERLGLHRVELEVYAHNHRARHVYEKLGFVVEGTRREAQMRDGEWVDEVVMALPDREWPPLRSVAHDHE